MKYKTFDLHGNPVEQGELVPGEGGEVDINIPTAGSIIIELGGIQLLFTVSEWADLKIRDISNATEAHPSARRTGGN